MLLVMLSKLRRGDPIGVLLPARQSQQQAASLAVSAHQTATCANVLHLHSKTLTGCVAEQRQIDLLPSGPFHHRSAAASLQLLLHYAVSASRLVTTSAVHYASLTMQFLPLLLPHHLPACRPEPAGPQGGRVWLWRPARLRGLLL
jgi:hypothetical protein